MSTPKIRAATPTFNAGTLTFYKRHGFTQGKRYVQFFEDRTKKK